jgi:hypothetical protein
MYVYNHEMHELSRQSFCRAQNILYNLILRQDGLKICFPMILIVSILCGYIDQNNSYAQHVVRG